MLFALKKMILYLDAELSPLKLSSFYTIVFFALRIVLKMSDSQGEPNFKIIFTVFHKTRGGERAKCAFFKSLI